MTGHIYIYGEIGKQVTLDTVLKEITPKASDYVVHIHSNGGDVFEGYAIYNAIKNTGKEISVFIEGVCASIATLIASSASPGKIIMNTKSQFMIHNPRISSMSGDSKDLRSVAGQLDKIKSQLIDSWIGRTNLNQQQLSQMYDNETWLTPEQAKEMGFVDEVQEVLKAVASADIKKFKYMEDKKTILGAIEALKKNIQNFFSPKNLTDTLADGTVIVVPDEEPWTGKSITTEDGAPLPPGEHTLASGRTIVVGEDGNVSEVREPEAKTEQQEEPTNDEDMKLKAELETAQARIKELESALQATTDGKTKAEAKAKSFENKMNTELKALTEKLAKIENTTVGDTTPPDKGVNTPFTPDAAMTRDPMKELFGKIIIDPRK